MSTLTGEDITILLELRLVHLELQPGPVDHLVNEHGPQKDFAEGDSESPIPRELGES